MVGRKRLKFFSSTPKIDVDKKVSTSYTLRYLIKGWYEREMVQISEEVMREGHHFGYELVKQLLQMRQENGKPMSQYRIAKVLGLSDQAVYKWVKG